MAIAMDRADVGANEFTEITDSDGNIIGLAPAVENPDALLGPEGAVLFQQVGKDGEQQVAITNLARNTKIRSGGKPIAPLQKVWRRIYQDPNNPEGGHEWKEVIVPTAMLGHYLRKRHPQSRHSLFVLRVPANETKTTPRPVPCPMAELIGCRKTYRTDADALLHAKAKHPKMWDAQQKQAEARRMQVLEQAVTTMADSQRQTNDILRLLAERMVASPPAPVAAVEPPPAGPQNDGDIVKEGEGRRVVIRRPRMEE